MLDCKRTVAAMLEGTNIGKDAVEVDFVIVPSFLSASLFCPVPFAIGFAGGSTGFVAAGVASVAVVVVLLVDIVFFLVQ